MIGDFERCCNCGACYNICPNNAITINQEGMFYMPSINLSRCIGCDLCSKVCPVGKAKNVSAELKEYVAWHKDEQVVLGSSSGGAFYGLAQNVLSNGGTVYSAAYSGDYKSVVFLSNEQTEFKNLQKSKYVESLVGLSFREIKKTLEKGREVLFCGTPCQVAGLKSYLGKDYTSLITCDFVCGGLPSHKLFAEHISNLERKYNSKIECVDFRPKLYGWKRYAISLGFSNGKKYIRLGTEDAFLRNFLYGKYTVRENCLSCEYEHNHVSDITIADCWEHEKLTSRFNKNGMSLIVCNTQKGLLKLETVKDCFEFEVINTPKEYANIDKKSNARERKNRETFLSLCEKEGLMAAHGFFDSRSTAKKIKHFLIRCLLRDRRESQ